MRGYAAERVGALELARDAAEETLESVLVSGNTTLEYWGAQLAAWVAVAQGRIDEALAQGEVAAERTREHPPASAGLDPWPLPTWPPATPSGRWRRSRSSAGWTRVSRRSTGCGRST